MKAKSFTYGRTISRDYQSRKLEVTFDLEEGESLSDAIVAAKGYVDARLAELDAPKLSRHALQAHTTEADNAPAPTVAAPRFRG